MTEIFPDCARHVTNIVCLYKIASCANLRHNDLLNSKPLKLLAVIF